jgi:hypothetical protein
VRILAHLNNNYGGKTTKEISYWGTLEQAKVDLYYVEYSGNYYEWVVIGNGFGGYDYEAQYAKLSYPPPKGSPIHVLYDSNWGAPKCECGAEKVGSPGHSHWCPKWRS